MGMEVQKIQLKHYLLRGLMETLMEFQIRIHSVIKILMTSRVTGI